jgi:hypothetical protein
MELGGWIALTKDLELESTHPPIFVFKKTALARERAAT